MVHYLVTSMGTIAVVREVVSGAGDAIETGGSAAGAHVFSHVIDAHLASSVVIHGFDTCAHK